MLKQDITNRYRRHGRNPTVMSVFGRIISGSAASTTSPRQTMAGVQTNTGSSICTKQNLQRRRFDHWSDEEGRSLSPKIPRRTWDVPRSDPLPLLRALGQGGMFPATLHVAFRRAPCRMRFPRAVRYRAAARTMVSTSTLDHSLLGVRAKIAGRGRLKSPHQVSSPPQRRSHN